MRPSPRMLARPTLPGALWGVAAAIMLLLAACQPIQPAGAGTVPPPQSQSTPTATDEPAVQQAQRVQAESTSPDGRWIASTVALFDTQNQRYYQRLVLRAADGDSSYVLVDAWQEMALGYTIAVPLTWSEDSRRLYYTNRPTLDGCGLFTNGSDLWRVDVASGEATEVLPPVTSVLALAPDEQQVAYLKLGEPALAIRQLGWDVEESIPLESAIDDGQLGMITWSPTGERLAFLLAHQPCSNAFAQATSIYVVDVAAQEVTPLLLHDERLLVPQSWRDERTLQLTGQSGESAQIDVITGAQTDAQTE